MKSRLPFWVLIIFAGVTVDVFSAGIQPKRAHLFSETVNRRDWEKKEKPRPRIPERLAGDSEPRPARSIRPLLPARKSCPVQVFHTSYGKEKENGLNRPHGVGLGKDSLYVADTWKSRIVKYSLDGKFLTAWDLTPLKGDFETSRGLAVDSKGNVYVGVEKELAIRKYSPDGKLLKRWSAYDRKEPYPDGQHNGAWDIAISDNDEIYALDPNIGQVDVYDTEGKKLRVQAKVPLWSVGLTVASGPNPTVYVADTFHGRVLTISADGKKIQNFTDTKMTRTYDVALDENGDVYATDYMEHAIYRFSPDGTLVAKIQLPKTSPGELTNPRHFVIKGCTLYIADGGNNRIAVFGPPKE